MSFICESGIGHSIGELVQSIIIVSLYKKMPNSKSVASFIGWVSHEIIVEPMIDASICYTQETFYTAHNLLYSPISSTFDLLSSLCNFVYNNFNSVFGIAKTTLSFLSITSFTLFSHSLLYNEENKIASFAKLIPINMLVSYGIKHVYNYLLSKSNLENDNIENLNLYPDISVDTTTESSQYFTSIIEKCYPELD